MNAMTTMEYQKNIYSLLQAKLGGLPIKNEWTAFKKDCKHYSPRIDIAVGPFNIGVEERENEKNNCLFELKNADDYMKCYNDLVEQENIKSFMKDLYVIYLRNINGDFKDTYFNNLLTKNKNARCLIAIEIENKNKDLKYFLGSLVNAASLGRVGICIACSEDNLRKIIRIQKYLNFLKEVEKNTYDTANFMIITREQMNVILNKH